jgi:hypothetical protein
MDHQKVFISHSGGDNEIIEKFERSLKAITIKPFLAEQFVATGQNVPKKIAEHIRDSNAFVPFLTRSSLGNQWVNQEIGYAYGWMEAEGIDPPYFFPVLEEGLQHSIKGFLGIPVVEYVPLKPGETKQGIYRLLLSLRKYIDRNWTTLSELVINCPSCRATFSRDIPSQETIDEAIGKKEPLESECKVCKKHLNIDPYTLVAEGHRGGQRW